LDEKLFHTINGLSGHLPLLDKIMIFVSNKGRYLYFFVIIYLLMKDRELAKKVLLSMTIGYLIDKVIRLFVYKPRPFMKRKVGILIPSKLNSSFPSKHALLVFCISTSIYLRNKVLGTITTVLSILTSLSRIWLGHHYPTDILGSAIIAVITSTAINNK
jgi:undecaprenyl-diphosphatase